MVRSRQETGPARRRPRASLEQPADGMELTRGYGTALDPGCGTGWATA
jgi:hypothetical protein